MISKQLTVIFTSALTALTLTVPQTSFAQAIRSDIERNSVMGCYDAVFYNNGNTNANVTVDYEYKGADGSFFTNRMTMIAYAGQKSTQFMPSHTVDCKKQYTVRITNWQAR